MIRLGLASKVDTFNVEQALAPFDDVVSISSWARESTARMLKANIVNGMSSNKIAPLAYITRGEVAVVLCSRNYIANEKSLRESALRLYSTIMIFKNCETCL
ncbi:S-layer homology domain-containing protein [Paenibacillus sp. IITD108]|uniref:S-layer homology domain-containing protein n=1 Tax=Paenibacillus sp. IITD108 TaxID=3116649 RepID=UPI002F3E2764